MPPTDSHTSDPLPSDLHSDIRAVLMPGLTGTEVSAELAAHLAAGLGGVGIFGSNILGPAPLRELTAEISALNPAAIIALDEEGGDVTRLFAEVGSPFPGNAVLGSLDDLDYTEHVAQRVGLALQDVGITLTMAPCVDVNSDPRNPVIGVRSFGADPQLVARHARAWTAGLRSTGVLACPKHFPGHGDTAEDSHLGLPVVDVPAEVLRMRDLPAFAAAIAAGAETVMTSHIMLPRLDAAAPATFSPAILDRLLRGELGFTGAIVSDALDMKGASGTQGIGRAAVRALAAGCDLLCLGPRTEPAVLDDTIGAITAALASGELSERRIRDAARRVRALHSKAGSDTVAGSGHEATAGCSDTESRTQMNVMSVETAEVERVLGSFSGLEEARGFLHRHPNAPVVQVDSEANIAVGEAPWGLSADLAVPLLAPSWGPPLGHEIATATAHSDWPIADPGLIVIVRDLGIHPEIRTRIARVLESGGEVLLIDMGWPWPMDRQPGLTILNCRGASRLIGAAVRRLLTDGASA